MNASTRHFVRHYAEMIAAMFVGMGILALPVTMASDAVGMSSDDPAAMLIRMAVMMTVPMVAWMRFRGHGWAPCADMTAAMVVPTAGVLALLWGDLVTEVGTLMVLEHVAMLPSMLVAMLARRQDAVVA